MGADIAAAAMFSVVSRKNAALSSAAWAELRRGQRRVLECPGRGDFAMTPIAQLTVKTGVMRSSLHVWLLIWKSSRGILPFAVQMNAVWVRHQ
jgi:hypothetical protein